MPLRRLRPQPRLLILSIFSLIEDYRTAAKTMAAATSEFSRREEMLIEQGWGLGPFISVLDVSGTYTPHPVLVYKHEYIDIHIPPDRFPEVNAAAHASLDAKFEQRKAILGTLKKSCMLPWTRKPRRWMTGR